MKKFMRQKKFFLAKEMYEQSFIQLKNKKKSKISKKKCKILENYSFD